MEVLILVISFIFFGLIILSYTIERLDFVAISLLLSFICAALTGVALQLGIWDFVKYIEFEAIITILAMSIITKIAEDSNILEYLAVELFKLSKGNQRVFFYLICIITTLLAAVITDVVVVLIIAPVVIRLCHFLKIRSGTYLMGMTICINIGSIITPFSSGENIIISSAFNLDSPYFIQNFWIFSFFLLFMTVFLLDSKVLNLEERIGQREKTLMIDLINSDILVKNKKMFLLNSFGIVITILLFIFLPELYLVAMVSAMVLVLLNKGFTSKRMSDLLRDVEWEVIFFFISLYIVIGCLLEAGFREIFINIPFQIFPPMLLAIVILLVVSLLSGFVANTPTVLIFIPIIQTIITEFGFPATPLIFALIVGVNLGGNIFPQGAAADLMTLKVARDSGVDNLNYRRLLKNGALFALIHIAISTVYIVILSLFHM
jgi:Na+/H+ antiporter NhaD/arsenite permease-like protein